MPEERWRVIFEDSATGTSPGGPGAIVPSSNVQSEAARSTQTIIAPSIANMGKFFAPLVGMGTAAAFLLQMMKRSKVFSTVMDSMLTVMSSMVDLLFLPMLPLLIPALEAMTKLLPVIQKISEFFMPPAPKPPEPMTTEEAIQNYPHVEPETIISEQKRVGVPWADEYLRRMEEEAKGGPKARGTIIDDLKYLWNKFFGPDRETEREMDLKLLGANKDFVGPYTQQQVYAARQSVVFTNYITVYGNATPDEIVNKSKEAYDRDMAESMLRLSGP